MLALVAERGDVAIRSDINATFILSDEPANTLSNWLQLPIPGDAVLSVQGQVGVVTLPEDGPIGTASLRTLGTGAQQALPGTHSDTTKVSKTGDTMTGQFTFSPGPAKIASATGQFDLSLADGLIRSRLTVAGVGLIFATGTLNTRIRYDDTGVGLNGNSPVAKAAAITQPTGGRTSTKAVIDAILTSLGNIGITAAPIPAALTEQFTDADIAVANKDGIASTPSLRTLGTGAQQAASGNRIYPGQIIGSTRYAPSTFVTLTTTSKSPPRRRPPEPTA